MYVLIPPSEGKNPAPGEGVFRARAPELVADAQGVLDHVAALAPAARMKFLGQKDAGKARDIHARNLAALDGPTLPAIARYTGVVCQHLDYPTLRRKADARKRLLFVSGLFGLVRADAPLPEYKLPINPWLARYWREINGARLRAIAKNKPVLNLLPQAYAKAVDFPGAIKVDFKVAGGKQSAGHFGKAIKGKFLRFLIEERVMDLNEFDKFREDGYRFDGAHFVQG